MVIWDTDTFKRKKVLIGHTNYVTCLALAPNGSILGSGSKDGTLILWEIAQEKVYKILKAGKPINCIAFSNSKAWAVIGTSNSLQVWDIKDTKQIIDVVLEPHPKDKANK